MRSAPSGDAARLEAVLLGLTRSVKVASVLASSRRRLDLSGIEDSIGRACAGALDLDAADGERMVPLLTRLRDELDRLAACLAEGRHHAT